MHPGQGPGLSLHDLGETGGSETVTLLESEIPSHSHALMALAATGNRTTPIGNTFARVTGATPYLPGSPTPPLANMSDQTIAPAGGDQPHNNLQPFLTFYFNIALQGVFPARP
jgi:microcystin-dependent protein